MDLNKYKNTYDERWKKSINTKDDDILTFDKPKTQVEFFYNEYNKFLENIINNSFENINDKELLEIGCGRATASIYLNKMTGIKIVASDYSEDALAIAQKNMDKYNVEAKCVQADLYKLPFDDNTFNCIISLGVMEHIDDPLSAYKEMLRVLKPNGVMISMNVPEHPDNIQRLANKVNSLFVKMEQKFSNKVSKPWLDKTQSKTDNVYRSTWYGDEFKGVVEKAGFENIEVVEGNVFPTFSPIPKVLDYLIVKAYKTIMFFRRLTYRYKYDLECSAKNSRMHFIIGRKR